MPRFSTPSARRGGGERDRVEEGFPMSLRFILPLYAAGVLAAAAAHAAPPVASITSPRTSCVAPCAIFFDARGSSDSDLSSDAEFSDLIYSWNFGDPDSGNWEEGARAGTGTPHSRNRDTGFVAGHVYENPGTYTATLTVSDGNSIDTDSIVISIQDPNSVWSGSNTICIGNSTPSAGSGGCPSGAAVMQSNDFDAAISQNSCDDSARRCLFRRGDTFAANQDGRMTTSGPTLIGAFGSGPKPVVNGGLGTSVFRFDPGNRDIRVQDLQIIGQDGDSFDGGVAFMINSSGVPIDRLLINRVDVSHYYYQIHFRGPNNEFTPGVNIPREVAIIDSSIVDGPGDGGTDVYLMWEQSLFMGNRAGDKQNGTNGHVVRAKFSHGVVYSHNSLGLLNDSGGRIGCGDRHHIMKVVSGLATDHPGSGVSREWIMADNYISSCRNNAWDVDIGRTDDSPQKLNEGQRNFIVERNYFTKRYSTRASTTSLQVEGDHPIVRNNIFDLSGAGATSTPRGVKVWNRAQVSNPPVPTVGVQVVNNTCYENSSTVGDGLCIEIGADANNTEIRNNLLFDAGSGRARGPAELIGDSGSGTSTCAGCNVFTTSSPFVSSSPTTLSHFAPSAGSSVVDAGDFTPVSPINFTTFAGPMDGDDNSSAIADIGAWERDGDPPPDGGGGGNEIPAAPVLLP